MAQILVRNLDEKVVKRLKRRAKKDGRSLQSEVKLILEQAVNELRMDMETAKKLCEQYRKRFKGRKFPDTVELIHEDRNR
jgi:plasmid stability protein